MQGKSEGCFPADSRQVGYFVDGVFKQYRVEFLNHRVKYEICIKITDFPSIWEGFNRVLTKVSIPLHPNNGFHMRFMAHHALHFQHNLAKYVVETALKG